MAERFKTECCHGVFTVHGERREIPNDRKVSIMPVMRPIILEGQFTIESRGLEFDEKVKAEFQKFIDRVNELAKEAK